MNVEPLVSVVRGAPTEAELAALVTIVAARSAGLDAAARRSGPARSGSAWVRSARPTTSPSSWRTSTLPGRQPS